MALFQTGCDQENEQVQDDIEEDEQQFERGKLDGHVFVSQAGEKYGLKSHLEHTGYDGLQEKYLLSLLGRINYVLSADQKKEFEKYKDRIISLKCTFDTNVESFGDGI